MRRKIGTDKFEVLGINLDGRPLDAVNFMKRTQADWPQISMAAPSEDPDDVRRDFPGRFGLDRIPLKLLVDGEGNVLATGVTLREIKPVFDKLFPGVLPAELDQPIDIRAVLPKPESPQEQQGGGSHAGHAH